MLLNWGSWGYQIGAVGILILTLIFLVTIRWWTDWLGRVVAMVLITTSNIVVLTTLRQLGIDLPGGILLWRVISFWAFALGVWTGLGTLVWAQFVAPRVKKKQRMTTRREHRNEEDHLAAPRPSRDGDRDDHPAGER